MTAFFDRTEIIPRWCYQERLPPGEVCDRRRCHGYDLVDPGALPEA
jgi:hypothetical protein